jgi:hypothetical protein
MSNEMTGSAVNYHEEEEKKKKALEEVTHYKIWADCLVDEFQKLGDNLATVEKPEDLGKFLDFGYSQYSRILINHFKRAPGTMGEDIETLIKTIYPESNARSLYGFIPYREIDQIEKFKQTGNKTDLPSSEDIKMASTRVSQLSQLLTAAMRTASN